MASRKELSRNNLRAGVFVTLTIVVALGVVFALSGAVEMFRKANPYSVTYRVADGVRNLKSGAEVRVGGLPRGRVTAVQLMDATVGEPIELIRIDFELDRAVALFQDARILINGQLIGETSWLEIQSVGTAAEGAVSGPIEGATGSGMLSTFLGEDNDKAIAEIRGDLLEFGDLLARMDDEYEELVVPILGDVRSVTSDIDRQWSEQWSGKVDGILEWGLAVGDRVTDAIASGDELLMEARAVVSENREPIGNAIANVQAASVDVRDMAEHLNRETLARLDALLESGNGAVDEAAAVVTALRADYAGWSTYVEEILADSALAAGQLKFGLAEVRHNPWKLVYRPTDKEFDHVMLYEATRAFAVAAADLKASSRSISRVLDEHGDRIEPDGDRMRMLSENLASSLDRYEKTQLQLMDVLKSEY